MEELITKCSCNCETCDCQSEEFIDEEYPSNSFEGQFNVEMGYIFGPGKHTGYQKTIDLKEPRKNPS